MIRNYYKFFTLTVCVVVLGAAKVAFASHGGFHALAGIPGIANPDALSTEAYVQALYNISITAAALLVVFKLMVAGVQYMFSEIVTKKEDAKKDIRASLIGLLIILSAVTLLNTINPNLTTLNFLRNAEPASMRIERNPNGNGVKTYTCNGRTYSYVGADKPSCDATEERKQHEQQEKTFDDAMA